MQNPSFGEFGSEFGSVVLFGERSKEELNLNRAIEAPGDAAVNLNTWLVLFLFNLISFF